MTQTIIASDARLVASDYQTLSQTAVRIRMTRSIVDGQGYEYCSPGARVSFVTTSTSIVFTVLYNNLVTRDDARNFIAAVYVDGVLNSTFHGADNVTAEETYVHTISGLSSAPKTVSLVWPYGDGMDLLNVGLDDSATISLSPPRPARKILTQGDSITHGSFAPDITKAWSFKLATAKGRQLVNLGYGGRAASAADGLQIGVSGVDRVVYMIGFNNFYPNTNVAAFQTAIQGWITNARATLPSARLYVISPIYSTKTAADYGHSTELQVYRDAVQSAVTAVGDSRTQFVNGLAIMTNSADRLQDGIHPNELGASEIAERLALIIPTDDVTDPGGEAEWEVWAANQRKKAERRAREAQEHQAWLASLNARVASILG